MLNVASGEVFRKLQPEVNRLISNKKKSFDLFILGGQAYLKKGRVVYGDYGNPSSLRFNHLFSLRFKFTLPSRKALFM